MAIVEVNHVTKIFQLGQLESARLKLQRLLARMSGHPLPERSTFKALDDVDFRIEEGEVIGIIGSNGAGKSTLLKILSRITVPTSGTVAVRGKVAPLIEVGAGLVGDMTGRENIYLNATILGMSKKEIAAKFDDIVAFCELEEFLDTPIKRYSSGMTIRLAFSIAASVDADILIIDEVLAVGDLAFQRKCFDRMEELIKRQGKTVLLVSHNIRQVERLCTRALLLDHGRIIADGAAAKICDLFFERSDEKIRRDVEARAGQKTSQQSTGQVDLLDVHMLDEQGELSKQIESNTHITVCIRYRVNSRLHRPMFFLGLHTTDFFYIATESTEEVLHLPTMIPGVYEVKCRIPHFPFLPGIYALRVAVGAGEIPTVILYAENCYFFHVMPQRGKSRLRIHEGVVTFNCEWSLDDAEHQQPRDSVLRLNANG